MNEIRIPQTLDAPPLALIFSASHLFSFIGFAIVGVVVGHPFILAGVGILVGSLFTRFSDKKPDGYLRHILYFHGLPILSGRSNPHGLDREMRP